MVHWVKETLVNRPLAMSWCEKFYSVKIKFQSLDEPVILGCELPQCFSVSTPKERWDRIAERARIGHFPSVTWRAKTSFTWKVRVS